MRRVALVLLAFVAGGCGGTTTPRGSAVHRSAAAADASPGLAYARCMRSHGVPSFPDPLPGGGFVFHAGGGVDPSSPAFSAAQAACRKLMPLGGLAPGTTTHPTDQWLAQMVKAAQCMRRHGIASFPDPTTTIPPMPTGGRGVISDIDGVIFEFTDMIDTQSPAFVRAAKACGFPLHNH